MNPLARFLAASLVPRQVDIREWAPPPGWRLHYRTRDGRGHSMGPYSLDVALDWMARFSHYENVEEVWIAKVYEGGAP